MSKPKPLRNEGVADLLVEHAARFDVCSFGANERNNQVDLCATVDGEADAAEYSIYFPKSPKTVDVNRLHSGRLEKQFSVVHRKCPQPLVRGSSYAPLGNCSKLKTSARNCYKSFPPVDSISAVPSFGTSTRLWARAFRSVCERYHQLLNRVWQFGEWERQSCDYRSHVVLSAEKNDSNDTRDNLHFVNAVEKNFLGVMRIDHVHLVSPGKYGVRQ
ncbi:hypothetical protein [Bradyrhizobium centrolobii]|uniref:hypothetical protein n=1 Tax=Bradyrhizobium centrolobii TaxID=1505087 RepID=UPI0010A96E0E|nr:hypothetical protein [Bradyrhizobium centrolobii]